MPSRKRQPASNIYQIKITLRYLRPPIWRRVLVPAAMTFADLHDVIQLTMGWDNSHLHEFTIGSRTIGMAELQDEFDLEDEDKVTLQDVITGEKVRFRYQYDFGDSWDHEILLEKILPPDPTLKLPHCVKGKRACPPDDVGGVWGYANFVEALADPNHPEHEDMVEWFGDEFDPEAFDLDAVNQALSTSR
ncbi:MAG: hypothetical protein KJZ93_02240 [Caldilineaceae bacterium]|nr:hypothetical protein [Caldilineaceae bacterium]